MNNIYGISFRNDGKVYYFKSDIDNLKKGDLVVVDTEKGIQVGSVVNFYSEDNVSISKDEMKEILRVANKDDLDTFNKNFLESKRCLEKVRKIAAEMNLNMNIIDASYTLDKKQLLFTFVSDERIDFRDLAKKIANIYKTRIELRQIGARDKARNVCGIGQCGRTLCCSTFLNHIDSITMNMAKNQNLALNPSKINGLCGRLMCCLTYEDEEYCRCQKGMPSVGQTVKVDGESSKVVSVDVLKRSYKVDIDGFVKEVQLEDVSCCKQ